MRVLSVVSSSNQLYSGIGRALFELAWRLSERVEYEFAIDDLNKKNLSILSGFTTKHGMTLHVGRGSNAPDAIDHLNTDLPGLLQARRWDLVECVCWANAATNRAVLREIGETTLVYTPHSQPDSTIRMPAEMARAIGKVHRTMLRRADLTLCDSPSERRTLQPLAADRSRVAFLPLGCEFDEFHAGSLSRGRQLLFVGDLVEPRKRLDLAISLVGGLRRRWPGLKLVIIGNRGEPGSTALPDHLRTACEWRGYVGEEELRQAYRESAGLIMPSEYEAFGLPILEALASGTPVFLQDQAVLRSLFGNLRGVHFCPMANRSVTVPIIDGVLSRGEEAIRDTLVDRSRLEARFDWDVIADAKWEALSAAWFLGRRPGGSPW